MGAPTNVYVDPSLASNTGTGTIGDPFGDLQYALDNTTQDATNGNQFNIKAGTAELLTTTLDFTTFGTGMSYGDPFIMRGYTSVANDGGIAKIDMQGNNSPIFNSPSDSCHLIDIEFTNSGTANLVELDSLYCSVVGCKFSNTSGSGVVFTSGRAPGVFGCEFSDIGTYGISGSSSSGTLAYGNWFKNGTKAFTSAIYCNTGMHVLFNIISVSGASSGILITGSAIEGTLFNGNSILSSGGTGKGIEVTSGNAINVSVVNNLIEGFSGTNGVGIDLSSVSRNMLMIRNNAVYNCATSINYSDELNYFNQDLDEVLTASPFAKVGADTFANRFNYFAPTNVGNVIGGAW